MSVKNQARLFTMLKIYPLSKVNDFSQLFETVLKRLRQF